MFERIMHNNELISLTVMLMMAMALVASQADATIQDDAGKQLRIETTQDQQEGREMTSIPLRATIDAHINGEALTVTIDTMARFGIFRVESK